MGRAYPSRLSLATLITGILLTGCQSLCVGPSLADRELADRVRSLIQKAQIPGVKQVQASARNGLVTLGGIVETPVALQRAVVLAASDPHVRDLSFLGVKFDPPALSDAQIVEHMRAAARKAIGPELAEQLGYFCEDHFGVVYGTLPNLRLRQQLDEAIRNVPGIGPYFVAVEVVLQDPPPDEAVAQAVRKKLHNPLDVKNLLLLGSDIRVRVDENVVILEGTVKNFLAKLVATQQAETVDGVRYVINHLRVDGAVDSVPAPPSDGRDEDDEQAQYQQ